MPIISTTSISAAAIRTPWAVGSRPCSAPKHPDDPLQDAPKFPYYGTEHFGFTVDHVDAACDELRAKGADIAIGPLNRDASLRLAFVRGPEDIMIELVQSK